MKLSYTGGLKLTQQKRERQVYFSVYELFVLLYCSYISSSVKFFCYLKKKKTWSTFLSGQAYVVLLADGAKIYWISDHFFYQGFLHRHWRFTGQQGKEGDHLLFHSTTSTHSRTLRHLFATLHVRWLSRIFNCKLVFTRLLLDEIYHLIELPFEWLIDDAMFICLLDELILRFCYSIWHWKTVDLNSYQLSRLYY